MTWSVPPIAFGVFKGAAAPAPDTRQPGIGRGTTKAAGATGRTTAGTTWATLDSGKAASMASTNGVSAGVNAGAAAMVAARRVEGVAWAVMVGPFIVGGCDRCVLRSEVDRKPHVRTRAVCGRGGGSLQRPRQIELARDRFAHLHAQAEAGAGQ